jgi:hypothetical protein
VEPSGGNQQTWKERKKRTNQEERRTWLIKGHVPGYSNAANDRVPTTISLTLRVIAKEDTLNGLCSELGPLMKLKKDKGNTAKSTKVTILWWPTKEALKRSDTI